MQRTLVRLLADYVEGDVVKASDVRAVASSFSANVNYTNEILDTMGVLVDDRPQVFELWLESKLADLAPGIHAEVGRWARTLSEGGPRSRARHPETARSYLRAVLPALTEWSTCYHHLREITATTYWPASARCAATPEPRALPRRVPCSPGPG